MDIKFKYKNQSLPLNFGLDAIEEIQAGETAETMTANVVKFMKKVFYIGLKHGHKNAEKKLTIPANKVSEIANTDPVKFKECFQLYQSVASDFFDLSKEDEKK